MASTVHRFQWILAIYTFHRKSFWPKSAGDILTSLRTIQHFSLNNLTLLAALTDTARKVGAFDLFMKPVGEFKSEISFVNMYATADSGITIVMPTYGRPGIDDVIGSGTIAKWVKIIENDQNSCEKTRIIGDQPAVERFLQHEFR